MKGKVPKGFLIGKKSRQEEGEDFAEEFIVSFGVVSVGVVVRVRMGGKGARGGGGGVTGHCLVSCKGICLT